LLSHESFYRLIVGVEFVAAIYHIQ
jgi:hypothetical protein